MTDGRFNSSPAFTLLETMVALGIFSLVVIGCGQAIKEISASVAQLRMEGEARRSLESHAFQLRGLQKFPENKPQNLVSWTRGITIKDDIQPVADEEARIEKNARLYRVLMVASWMNGAQPQSLTNTILIHSPQ